MTNRFLTHNGAPCGTCQGSGSIPVGHFGATARCPDCRGLGRIAIPDEEIVAVHVEEARRWYWPERVRRWAR